MEEFDFDSIPQEEREHVKNVLDSLYHWGEPDENPILYCDPIPVVIGRMGIGVHKLGVPELTALDIEMFKWAYQNVPQMPREWPSTAVMYKELESQAESVITEEQIADILDIAEWEVKPRMLSEEGIKMCWIGGVLRPMAYDHWNTLHGDITI